MRIRQILERKEIILRKKRLVTMLCCIVVLIALYVIITWPGKQEIEPPVVSVEPVGVEDVEIYGDYVGRVRAQQFVNA